MNSYRRGEKALAFVSHIDGDCLNAHDGVLSDAGLTVTLAVRADAGRPVRIGGQAAIWRDGLFWADVTLAGYRSTVTATDGEDSTTVVLYRLPHAAGKYRLSSDDNILFLADITANKDVYQSVFENPYLAVYKKAHDLYGAKVHLNLFWEFVAEESGFPCSRAPFDLSMMTDKFRDEFRANADWLKLSFHARKEKPNQPYRYAAAEEITADFLRVTREIVRFAGPECLSDCTTVHFGETSLDALRALRALGIRFLTGYFERDHTGAPLVAYHTDGALLDHVGARDFWYDIREDILFGRIDLVLNLETLSFIESELPRICDDGGRGGFVSVMIHEQYFYPDYINYLPDFEARVLTPCRILCERGYVGSHICEAAAEEHVPARVR